MVLKLTVFIELDKELSSYLAKQMLCVIIVHSICGLDVKQR